MGFSVSSDDKSISSGLGTNDTIHMNDVTSSDAHNDVYGGSDDRAIMVYSLITGDVATSDVVQSISM